MRDGRRASALHHSHSMSAWSTLEPIALAVGVWMLATLAALAVVTLVVASLPPAYFCGEAPARPAERARLLPRLARNALGVLLIVLGALLSIPGVPGQGILTVLAGVILVDFPGRHRVACAIAGWPGVLAAMNAARRRLGRSPLAPPLGVRRSQRGGPAPQNGGRMRGK
ncbi:MAG TPA: hypothetical protein VFL90_05810 [Methylomirabilota bacterium]|nr:hypothetical protein [Methylomirabilota bacterium]